MSTEHPGLAEDLRVLRKWDDPDPELSEYAGMSDADVLRELGDDEAADTLEELGGNF